MFRNFQSSLVSSPAAEEEMPREGEEGEGTDGESEPVQGGVEGAELQRYHALSLSQAGEIRYKDIRQVFCIFYLGNGVNHEHRGHWLDDGADNEVGRGEVQEEDVVGGGGERGEISEDDEDKEPNTVKNICERTREPRLMFCSGPHPSRSVRTEQTIMTGLLCQEYRQIFYIQYYFCPRF